MGIFNLFHKKENSVNAIESNGDPIASHSTELAVRQNPVISIHEDLIGLIWFADGPFENYSNENIEKNTYSYNGLSITLRMTGDEEPSLIYTKQHIVIPSDVSLIERPPYFPNYSGLSPEQKGVYIKLLQNPYDNSVDIGFVFIYDN